MEATTIAQLDALVARTIENAHAIAPALEPSVGVDRKDLMLVNGMLEGL